MGSSCDAATFVVACLTGEGVDHDETRKFGMNPWDVSTVGLCVALHVDIPPRDVSTIITALCTAILAEVTSARSAGKARLIAAVIKHLDIALEVFDILGKDEAWMRHIAERGDEDQASTVFGELVELGVEVPDLLADAKTRYPRPTPAV